MAITKSTETPKIEVVNVWNVQVASDTVIKEDGVELTRSFHRHVVDCVSSSYDGSSWTHTDTDISGESTEVQAIANAVWTDDIKAAKKTANEASLV